MDKPLHLEQSVTLAAGWVHASWSECQHDHTQHMGVIRKAATTATTNLPKNNSKGFRVHSENIQITKAAWGERCSSCSNLGLQLRKKRNNSEDVFFRLTIYKNCFSIRNWKMFFLLFDKNLVHKLGKKNLKKPDSQSWLQFMSCKAGNSIGNSNSRYCHHTLTYMQILFSIGSTSSNVSQLLVRNTTAK